MFEALMPSAVAGLIMNNTGSKKRSGCGQFSMNLIGSAGGDPIGWAALWKSESAGASMDGNQLKSRTTPALVALGWCCRCSYWRIWALISVTIDYMILIEHEMRLNQIIEVRAEKKDYSRCTLQASIPVTWFLINSTGYIRLIHQCMYLVCQSSPKGTNKLRILHVSPHSNSNRLQWIKSSNG